MVRGGRSRGGPTLLDDHQGTAPLEGGSELAERVRNSFPKPKFTPEPARFRLSVAEKHCRERPLARWDDEIRCDRTALGTRVGNVMKSATVELFNDLVMNVEGLLRVVVEKMVGSQDIRCRFSRSLRRHNSEEDG